MATKKKSLNFEYKILPTYNVYAVSGAYGGLNAKGEIVVNLFHERTAIPRLQTFELHEDGSISDKPTSEERKDAIMRDVVFGISINPETARSLANWLNEKVDQYEEVIKKVTNAEKKK
jgi:hypothetical protein